MSFTPGPWELDGAQICIPGGCALADVHGADERASANARLMVAAPEMYELLREVKAWRDSPGNEGFPHDARTALEALLARIDGKEAP